MTLREGGLVPLFSKGAGEWHFLVPTQVPALVGRMVRKSRYDESLTPTACRSSSSPSGPTSSVLYLTACRVLYLYSSSRYLHRRHVSLHTANTRNSGRYAQHVTTILLLHAIVANKRHARYRARATPWATSPSTLRKLGRKEQLTQLDTVDFDRSFRMVQTARGCGKHPRCV